MAKQRKVVPLGSRVLIMREKAEEKIGNILIPDSAQKKPKQGEVLAVGEGRTLDDGTVVAMRIKAGDVVLFNSYAGSDIEIDGEEYLIMAEDDVLAKIER